MSHFSAQNCTRLPWLSTCALLVVAILACVPCNTARAADATFVGTLALAVEPEVTRQLKLSDETQQALAELIAAREGEVLELALEIKDLSKAQQEAELAPYRAESEKKGLALLTDEQRARLEQIRLERLGGAALLEPVVAARLKLTDEQKSKVVELLKGAGEGDARRAEIDRQIGQLLNPTQRSALDAMIGLAAAAPTAEVAAKAAPTKSDPKIAAVLPVDVRSERGSAGEPDSQRSSKSSAATASTAATAPAKSAAATDGKLHFSSRHQPWREVLEWFAQQADLSLVADLIPPGTFNYQDSRGYTPGEAIDLLNSVLLTKGFTLVRNNRMLMLINLADG
ncbi:MAG: hypothetical protein SGJ20_17330, partial [Planctomycetota bacterium]|nr:hypothetical protein [Planctomycetota bacterium]